MRPAAPIDPDCPLATWFSADESRTQTGLAEAAKVSAPSVMNFIRGKRGLEAANYLAIAKATGIEVEKLMAWGERSRERRERRAKRKAAAVGSRR